jgi:HAE1 family hydrophobic/amphiphilic exporter-1
VAHVQQTLLEAIALVVIVIVVFLQSWRAAIIPILAIPVSLVGAFAVLLGFGYSLNNLSLFGLVLAIGIVVDDAIVVVENVERNLRAGMNPKDAAHKTMDEVSGALIAIALVLTAVFVPTAFITGISGQFYRQFALTIASATLISCFVSLTLSPALAALVLRPRSAEGEPESGSGPRGIWRRFSHAFDNGFDRLSTRYGALTARTVRRTSLMLVIYVGLIALAGWRFAVTPVGFIPAQDQGYFIAVTQLPPGAALTRTDAVVRQEMDIARKTPGVDHVVAFVGLDGASFTNAPNAATMFIQILLSVSEYPNFVEMMRAYKRENP